MTEKQKHLLKKISKIAAYTAMTGGAYLLARGALSLLLKQLEMKIETNLIIPNENAEPAFIQSPNIIKNLKIRSATP